MSFFLDMNMHVFFFNSWAFWGFHVMTDWRFYIEGLFMRFVSALGVGVNFWSKTSRLASDTYLIRGSWNIGTLVSMEF